MRTRNSLAGVLPDGFAYQPDFIQSEEESDLLRILPDLNWRSFKFQGYVARRRIVSYGFEYDRSSRRTSATEPLPEFLQSLKQRSAAWAGLDGALIQEAVITEYPKGAPIGWHRDVPPFEHVLGISLASACRMRFKPYRAEGKIASVNLEPRSIYAMRGEARWNFQHSIAAVESLRYSITFRTLLEKNSPVSETPRPVATR
jgi:alkylated DNA repair dioxygenase AlkB